ncbi:MAG TPA: hypothetical protein VFF13_06045 [archaeon]|nr:hypothetical protein [archaeon]
MDQDFSKNLLHVGVLLVLLLGLLLALIFTGILGCSIVPGGCDIYYLVIKGGAPTILIAYGESGMGNHLELENILKRRDILGAQTTIMPIDRLSIGNITHYDLVIVEHAKKICTSQLKMFQDYVIRGGRLVWTADAGTDACEGDSLLLDSERNEGGKEETISPWARKDGNKQVSFDQFIGVNYLANYCEIVQCTPGEEIGRIEITNDSHKLTYGLSPTIPFYSNFSLVESNKQATTRIVATFDYGTNIVVNNAGTTTNYGNDLPFIVTGQIGERVVYYATPLENFVQGERPNKAIIEQMYRGMLYK